MLEQLMNEAKSLRLQGMKIKDIAETLGKCERTIYTYLCDPARKRKMREYKSILDPYKPYIDNILKDDPDYNRSVIFDRIKKLGYTGSTTILRDYAAIKANKYKEKAVIRFETEPGFQAQVDWKVHGTRIVDGQKKKLYAFVMVFGYSRAPFVIHTTCMDQATLLACHVLAFKYFNGVPKEILYDNMKTAFLFNNGFWKVNPKLLSFANHYGFVPRRCKVRRPQTKGKVERFIDYYNNNFFLAAKENCLENNKLNEGVLNWIKEKNKKKIRDLNQSREERFEHEKNYLIPLPETEYDYRKNIRIKVSRESLILYKTNSYSVPPFYIGREIEMKIDPFDSRAEVYSQGSFVRTLKLEINNRHERIYREEDRKALYQLWEKQQSKRVKEKTDKTAVITRSPSDYEKIITGKRIAS